MPVRPVPVAMVLTVSSASPDPAGRAGPVAMPASTRVMAGQAAPADPAESAGRAIRAVVASWTTSRAVTAALGAAAATAAQVEPPVPRRDSVERAATADTV